MLVGVDHLQLGVRDVAGVERLLERLGYVRRFAERLFVDQPGPRYHSADRAMVYLTKGRSAVELIEASDGASVARGYLPVVGSAWLAEAGIRSTDAAPPAALASLDLDWLISAEPSAVIDRLQLEVRALAPTSDFWAAAGGRVEPSGSGAAEICFPATVATMGLTLSVLERPGDAPPTAYVDDLGCTLVALLSTSLDADLARLVELGGEATEPFGVNVGGRALRCCITTAPGGELLELIEVGSR